MKVLIAPNPILRTKTKMVKKITPELVKVAKEMIKLTQNFHDPEGMGLSANQIGRSDSFFIARFGPDFKICINPKIISSSKEEKSFFEGCFSVPDYYGEVKRPARVAVTFQDETGKAIKKALRGTTALVFQHEVDHLNGTLFVDKVLQQKGKLFKMIGKDQTGSDVFEEVKI